MSWDVLLVKEKFDSQDESYTPSILGKREDIIQKLCALFSELDYTDKTWGFLNGDGFSMEFNTGENEDVESIMLHIRGAGNPLPVIHRILINMNWAALDGSTGEFMQVDNLSQESWIRFQQWRDRVIRKKL